jgi:hypothetical protein
MPDFRNSIQDRTEHGERIEADEQRNAMRRAAQVVTDEAAEIHGIVLETGYVDVDQARAIKPWFLRWLAGEPVYYWVPATRRGGRWVRVGESFPIHASAGWLGNDPMADAP